MAAVAFGCRANNLLNYSRNWAHIRNVVKRSIAADAESKSAPKLESKATTDGSNSDRSELPGWWSRLLVRSIDTGHESQSSMLSNKDTIYELHFDAVKPEHMDQYLDEFQVFADKMSASKSGGKLVGSWTVDIGDLDEAVHLWQFNGGYSHLGQHKSLLRVDKDFIDLTERRKKLLRSTRNQILLAFSFWPEIKPRDGVNIYELRSYVLKPGTMIEWGNNWATGIKFRNEQNETVGGYFSQIGDQNCVHYLWAYKSLQDRKESRESAWRRPGWDICVARTVPLIRHMTSRILIPTQFSPLQ